MTQTTPTLPQMLIDAAAIRRGPSREIDRQIDGEMDVTEWWQDWCDADCEDEATALFAYDYESKGLFMRTPGDGFDATLIAVRVGCDLIPRDEVVARLGSDWTRAISRIVALHENEVLEAERRSGPCRD